MIVIFIIVARSIDNVPTGKTSGKIRSNKTHSRGANPIHVLVNRTTSVDPVNSQLISKVTVTFSKLDGNISVNFSSDGRRGDAVNCI